MKHSPLLAAISIFFIASPCYAGVSKVSSPGVDKGIAEVQYSGTRYSDDAPSRNNQQGHTYEFEYGFTERFKLGVEAKSSREFSKGSEFEGYGLEAQYVLTNQGDWWLSSAAKAEFFHATEQGDADEFEAKLLASYRAGAATLTGNLNLARELGGDRTPGIGISSALQARYQVNNYINPGFEWHAEYGRLNDFDRAGENAHYVGPIVTGALIKNGKNELKYTAGYYWGIGGDATDQAARVQLGYEFGL